MRYALPVSRCLLGRACGRCSSAVVELHVAVGLLIDISRIDVLVLPPGIGDEQLGILFAVPGVFVAVVVDGGEAGRLEVRVDVVEVGGQRRTEVIHHHDGELSVLAEVRVPAGILMVVDVAQLVPLITVILVEGTDDLHLFSVATHTPFDQDVQLITASEADEHDGGEEELVEGKELGHANSAIGRL